MVKNVSKNSILKLLQQFNISITSELKNDLNNPNGPTYKELENAAADYNQHTLLIKNRKQVLNDNTSTSEANISVLDKLAHERILMQIDQTLFYAAESEKLRKMGAVGEELAKKLDSNRLANAEHIKQNIQNYAEEMRIASKKLKALTKKEKSLEKKMQTKKSEAEALQAKLQTYLEKEKLLETKLSELNDVGRNLRKK